MNQQELQGLQEAYFSVYNQPEVLNEFNVVDVVRKADTNINTGINALRGKLGLPPKKFSTDSVRTELRSRGPVLGPQTPSRPLPEEADLYDIILSHLLDEGYAETPEAAEVIMVNMSEDWRESICEELTGERRKIAIKKGFKHLATAREGSAVTQNADKNMPTRRGGSSGLKRNPNRWGKPGPIKPGPGVLNRDDRGSANKANRRLGKKVKDNENRYYWNDKDPDF